MSEQNKKSASQNVKNAKTVVKTAAKAASGDLVGAGLELAKNPQALKETGKKAAKIGLLGLFLNPLTLYTLLLMSLINILILLLGFGLLNPVGMTQQAQTTDFVAYEELACDTLRENHDPNLPEVCKKPLKKNMTKEELAQQLLKYNTEDQFKGFVILMRDAAAQEYLKTASFLKDFEERFNNTYTLPIPNTDMTLYKLNNITYMGINQDALNKEYDSPDDSLLIDSSAETWDINKNTRFNGGSIIMDGSNGMFLTIDDAAEVVAAYQTGMGDTYPVIRQPGDSETAVSYFVDFIAMLKEAQGSFYSATANVSEKNVTINYTINTIKWESSEQTIPGEFECVTIFNDGYSDFEVVVQPDASGNCPANATSRAKSKTVYTPSLNPTPETKSVDGLVYMFEGTFSGFQTHVIDALMITKAKFKDFGTGREYLFNEYQMDELSLNRSKLENPAKSCNFDAALGSLHNIFEGFANFLTGGNSDMPTIDHSADNFFKCMSEKTSDLISEMQDLYDAPFYRWEPIYYYECDHINYGYETCHHILDEAEASKYNSNKSKYNWNNGNTWEAGDICNAPIDTAHNGVISMVTEGITDFVSWLGDTGVAKWAQNILEHIPIIRHLDNVLGVLSEVTKSALISKHSIYSYERIELYDIETIGPNPIKKNHSSKKDLFENGKMWYIPLNEDYTVDGNLSDDFSFTGEKTIYFTIGDKLQGYKDDILEMNSELIEQLNSENGGGFFESLKVPPEMAFVQPDASATATARCLEGFKCKIYGQTHPVSSRVWGRVASVRPFGGYDYPCHQCVAYASGFFRDIFKRTTGMGGNGNGNASWVKNNYGNEFNSYIPPGAKASDSIATPPASYTITSSSADLARSIRPGTVVSSNPGSTEYGHIQVINDVGFAKKNSSGEWEFYHPYNGEPVPSGAIPFVAYSDGNVRCGGTRNHHVVALDEYLSANCPSGKMCVFTSPKNVSAYNGKFSSWEEAGSYDFVTGTKNAYDIKTQKCIKSACKLQERYDYE